MKLTDADINLLRDILPLVVRDFEATLTLLHRRNPEALLCSRLRTYTRETADLLKRLDGDSHDDD